jgi:hypothetical protein
MPTVYDWSAGDEIEVSLPDEVILPDPSIIADITGLAATSGTADLLDTGDGNVLSRINATWDAVTDEQVLTGGKIVLSYKLSAAAVTTWVDINIDPDQAQYYIAGVQDGYMYDLRIKAQNSFGVQSEWAYLHNHEVIGKTDPPSNIASFSVTQNGNVVVFQWPLVADSDYAGAEIRFGLRTAFAWDTAIKLTETTRGTQITTAAVIPGDWTFAIKAVDTSGNYSVTAATKDLVVANQNNVVVQAIQAPDWQGTLTNMGRHWTGKLFCNSQGVAVDDGWNTFDQYVPNPYASCGYISTELDLGFDDMVRTYCDVTAAAGPGVADFNLPVLELDYKPAAGSYDGYEPWTIGSITARYLKYQVTIDTSLGVPYLLAMAPLADIGDQSETITDLTVGAGGTVINFVEQYHLTPAIQVSIKSGSALIPTFTSPGPTGFTAHVFNTSGTEVGITAGYSYSALGS